MYENIRKPRLLKNIPLVLIRPLPVLYYYLRYFDNQKPTEKLKILFDENLNFFQNGLIHCSKILNNNTFDQIGTLADKNKISELKDLEQLTLKLSSLCSEQSDIIKNLKKEITPELKKQYQETVNNLHVVIINNNNEPDRISKLTTTLSNLCSYDVSHTATGEKTYSSSIINSDFVIFGSTHPASIHNDVKSLESYNKPGLAMAYSEDDKKAMRHGAQLLKIGFDVLFKIFTPIRLFTTIDKIYIRYQSENLH